MHGDDITTGRLAVAAHDARALDSAPLPTVQSVQSQMELPVVRKPATVQCLGAVDVSTLAGLVERLSEKAWQVEDARKENDYRCFHHTRHMTFRFIEANRNPWRYYSMPIWKVWRSWLLPVMRKATAPYGFREPVYPKAILARLQAGYDIDAHTDGEGSHPLTHRIHVPLFTNSKAMLVVDGTRFHLRAGRAYEVNNLAVHSAHNGGANDRIHFVFEVFDGAA